MSDTFENCPTCGIKLRPGSLLGITPQSATCENCYDHWSTPQNKEWTVNSFDREYQNDILDFDKEVEYQCNRCEAWLGDRSSLPIHLSVEQYHPLNKGRSPQCPDLHVTEFRQCPFCRRNLFADEKMLCKLKTRFTERGKRDVNHF